MLCLAEHGTGVGCLLEWERRAETSGNRSELGQLGSGHRPFSHASQVSTAKTPTLASGACGGLWLVPITGCSVALRGCGLITADRCTCLFQRNISQLELGEGAAQWPTHTAPSFAPNSSGLGCRTSKGRCAKFSPFSFSLPWKPGLPSFLTEAIQGCADAPLESRWPPSAPAGKAAPMLVADLDKKRAPRARTLGSYPLEPPEKGMWLAQGHTSNPGGMVGVGSNPSVLTEVFEGAIGHNPRGQPPTGWGITYNQLPGYRHTPLSL